MTTLQILIVEDGEYVPAPLQDKVLAVLSDGSKHRNEIAQLCSRTVDVVGAALSRLKHKGLVVRIGGGVWALKKGVSHE